MYAYILRNKVSQTSLTHLLRVMNIHMPLHALLPKTKYLMGKSLKIQNLKKMKRCYFCPKCQIDLPNFSRLCPNQLCRHKIDFKALKRTGYFYVHRNLKEALQNTLEMPTIAENLLQRYCDFTFLS